MSEKKLQRLRKERMLAGVIAGIARRYEANVTVMRIIFVLVSLFSVAFPGILVYLALWALMPVEPESAA